MTKVKEAWVISMVIIKRKSVNNSKKINLSMLLNNKENLKVEKANILKRT